MPGQKGPCLGASHCAAFCPMNVLARRKKTPLVFTKSLDAKPNLSLFSPLNESWGVVGGWALVIQIGEAEQSDGPLSCIDFCNESKAADVGSIKRYARDKKRAIGTQQHQYAV